MAIDSRLSHQHLGNEQSFTYVPYIISLFLINPQVLDELPKMRQIGENPKPSGID